MIIGAEDIPPGSDVPAGDAGDAMDAAMPAIAAVSPLRSEPGRNRRADSDDARSTPPKVDDWMDFFSNVIIRAATDFYIDVAFSDVPEDALTDREIQRIKMSVEERDRIARPFAELANKLKFTRKHGRAIIAAADIPQSAITFGMWFGRVNRIARRHRETTVRGTAQHVSSGPRTESAGSNGEGTPVGAYRIFQPGTG